MSESRGRRGPARGTPAVLVTRPSGEEDPLARLLVAGGLGVLAVPTVLIVPVEPDGPLDAAIAAIQTFDWVLVTSVAGVEAVLAAAHRTGLVLPRSTPPAWAAVGPASATALREADLPVALVPSRADGHTLAEALAAAEPLAGARILLPRADAADAALPARLRAAGASVEEVVAYRTVEGPAASLEPLRAAFARPDLAAIVVASGSAIRGLLGLLRKLDSDEASRDRLAGLAIVSIGPATSAAIRDLGLAVAAEAAATSPAALAEAVVSVVLPSPLQPAPMEALP
ncbi:MAG: uroporphyrinogen-III synthase [Candidatus Limnocylindrales bacterium]